VRELLDIKKNLAKLNKLEAYHDAQERRDDAQHMFTLGMMDLPDKAKIENLYWEISQRGGREFPGQAYIPRKSANSRTAWATNTSATSPCSNRCWITGRWGKLFPIMPVSRLNERPTREATLVDITCDSDGQINKFIDLRDVRDTLPLHNSELQRPGKQEPYYIGFFLMGAYQDIMGDLHNLFGRVNEVHVFLEPDEPTGYYVEEIIEGSTIIQCAPPCSTTNNELKRPDEGADGRCHQVRPHEAERGDAAAGRLRARA
jgi:arginine decarboxylase